MGFLVRGNYIKKALRPKPLYPYFEKTNYTLFMLGWHARLTDFLQKQYTVCMYTSTCILYNHMHNKKSDFSLFGISETSGPFWQLENKLFNIEVLE